MVQIRIEDYSLQDERIMKMWCVEQIIKSNIEVETKEELFRLSDAMFEYINTDKNVRGSNY